MHVRRRPAAPQAEPERHDRAPPITVRHACWKTSSSPDGRLRASAPANTNLTAHHLQIASPTAATRQRARYRRGSRARRHSHCHPSAASVRQKRIKHKRQIPIGPNRAPSRGFFPGGLSDAGPGAKPNTRKGRHPKPFTRADALPPAGQRPLWTWRLTSRCDIRRETATFHQAGSGSWKRHQPFGLIAPATISHPFGSRK